MFNDAHNTFLFKVIIMASGHIINELTDFPSTWATLSNQQQCIFYTHHSSNERTEYTAAFVTPDVERWLDIIATDNDKCVKCVVNQ